MHFDHGTGDGPGYGSFRTYTTAASEAWEQTNSYSTIRTEDNPSSNGGSYGNSTCASGYLGHYAHSPVGTKAHYGGMPRGFRGQEDDLAYAFRDVGIIVNETSQDYALFNRYEDQNKGYFIPTARSALLYLGSHVQNQSRSAWAQYNSRKHDGSNWGDGWYSGHGSFCYNKKLNKMVVMESNGSYKHRYAVWSNLPDLRAYAHEGGELWSPDEHSFAAKSRGSDKLTAYFNDNANKSYPYEEFDYTQNSYAGGSDTNYRTFIVLCDNERLIEVVFHQDAGVSTARWFGPDEGADAGKHMDGNGNASTNAYIQRSHVNGWPMYGINQGHYYGWRWHTTSDGRYVWFQAPEYYYHAGLYLRVIRVSDGKMIYYERGDSNYGWNCCPLGKSSMIMAGGYNTDSGQGARFKITNLDHVFARQTDRDSYDFFTSYSDYVIEGGGTYGTGHMHFIPAFFDTSLFNEINQEPLV